jgi:tetratricopeptide (TPR) repeat protein
MTGIFTDNQPDFSWIMPYEEKDFAQYFLPYRELGIIKNASKDLLLHFSLAEGRAQLKLFATSVMHKVEIAVMYKDEKLKKIDADLSPEQIFQSHFIIPAGAEETDFAVVIHDAAGNELLQYHPEKIANKPLPEAAKAPVSPEQTATNEMLYLTGLHLEQYRHATYNPIAYYEEALRRDGGDARCNNALGLLYMRRGLLKKSEPYFRKAIETLTRFNPNPYDGEVYYNLGLCLHLQYRFEEAYETFYKAAWSSAWQSNSFFALAQIDVVYKNYDSALKHVEQSLYRNAGDIKAVALKAMILRKQDRIEQAIQLCNEGSKNDAFNLALYFEKNKLYQLLNEKDKAASEMEKAGILARTETFSFIEYALDYSTAGLHEEAIEWLNYLLNNNAPVQQSMLLYYLGWNADRIGKTTAARQYFEAAFAAKEESYFPNRIEDIMVSETALKYTPKNYKATYYLGCLWYDKRQYFTAIDLWQKTIEINPAFPSAHRTLGIAYFNKVNDQKIAYEYFEKAFNLNLKDARILMELDQLRKRLNHDPAERLKLLEMYLPLVESRDDLYLERATLYNHLGRYEKAYELLIIHKFHPWEGGEGKVPVQYKYSLIQIARKQISNQNFESALALLQQAQTYPDNLGEGKLYGTPENEIFYWMGCAYEGLKQNEKADASFKKATQGVSQPSAAIFYNDPQPDSIFYQGLSWRKLGEDQKALDIFQALVHYGEKHLDDEIRLDYFAVSLPDLLVFDDNLDKRNKVHCLYMIGLGYLGLEDFDKALSVFEQVESADAMHQGTKSHIQLIPVYEKKELNL